MRSAKTVVIAALLSLFVPLISHAKNVHSHQLPPHQAKVIVTFEGEIQPDLVAKYGEVLTTLRIINGLVAVIDRASIHLLRAEPGVKDVGIVAKVRALDIERRRRNPNYGLDSSAGEEGALGESEALAGCGRTPDREGNPGVRGAFART